MTKHSTTTTQLASTTPLGQVLDQIHDHRIGADEPARLVFCPSTQPVIDAKREILAIDAD